MSGEVCDSEHRPCVLSETHVSSGEKTSISSCNPCFHLNLHLSPRCLKSLDAIPSSILSLALTSPATSWSLSDTMVLPQGKGPEVKTSAMA